MPLVPPPLRSATARSRSLALAAALLWLPAAAAAQQRPTGEEARELLRTRPELATQLRDRLVRSGMTPAQVRARLRAEGYPPDLLDAYLSDAAPSGTHRDSAFAALAALGIPADTTRALDTTASPDSAALARRAASAPAADDSGRRVFGLNIFEGRTTAFDPTVAGPVDANYVLGPGDQLVMVLTGDVEMAQTLDVTREGLVVVPRVGQLHVANLTLAQAETLLASRLTRVVGDVGRGTEAPIHFSLTVAKLRVNQVFVVGDVAVPGSYQVSSAGTALTALYAAGGPTANGSLRRIEIRRGGALVGELDLYDYLLRGDASRDVRLQTGDVVFVPVHGPHVRVVGEVTRPATYELRPGETLASVLAAAGGFTAQAARNRVLVERVLPPGERGADGRDRITLDVAGGALGSDAATRLVAGDVVRVFPVAEQVRDRVTVVGSVWAPGSQGLSPGMTLSQALRLAGGVRPEGYLQDVLVTRLLPDSTRQQLRATLLDREGTVAHDFELREHDEIRVFGAGEFREPQFVAIHGAVRNGGRYPYRRGMTLRDLVLLAGGLGEGAFLDYAELARVAMDGDPSSTATSRRVPLDSGYVRSTGIGSAQFGAGAGVARSAEDVLLEPSDNVLILRSPDYAAPRTVVVQGEVRFPGRYTLVSRGERLSDVLARAGGLTTEAYAEGVSFHRPLGGKGRVGVDLPRVLRDAAHRDNLVLQDGDSIVVPQFAPIVEVTGAVNSPMSVAYVPGASLEYYLRAAGGATRRGDVGLTYVAQANGKVESVQRRRLRPDAHPVPGAGSTVHVPLREETEGRDFGAVAAVGAQVLGALVALVAVVQR